MNAPWRWRDGVETFRNLEIYKFILIGLSLVDFQIIKNARYMYKNASYFLTRKIKDIGSCNMYSFESLCKHFWIKRARKLIRTQKYISNFAFRTSVLVSQIFTA